MEEDNLNTISTTQNSTEHVNEANFVESILSVFKHVGLVEKGRQVFEHKNAFSGLKQKRQMLLLQHGKYMKYVKTYTFNLLLLNLNWNLRLKHSSLI